LVEDNDAKTFTVKTGKSGVSRCAGTTMQRNDGLAKRVAFLFPINFVWWIFLNLKEAGSTSHNSRPKYSD
jgi:hypothetical protein